MQFSQEFINKYGTAEKATEMQDIINNAWQYIEPIKASDADKELLLETLYGFKHVIAEPAGINMSDMYPKMGNILSISAETYDRDSNAAGLCYCVGGTYERPVVITYSDTCQDKGEAYRKAVIIHETCHALSMEYNVIERNDSLNVAKISELNKTKVCESNGLNYAYEDEAVNDKCTADIANFLGYKTSMHNNVIETRAGDRGSFAYSASDVIGYVRISEYTKLLENTYGAPDLYKDKFLGEHNIENKYGAEHAKSVGDIFERLQIKTDSMEDHLKMENTFLPVIEYKWNNWENYTISDYMKDMQQINSASTSFLIDGNGGDGYKIDTMSAYQTAFEIRYIYSQTKGFENGEQLLQEMNFATRSSDCYDFLIAINGLKKLDVELSDNDLWNMEYKRTTFNGQSVIEVSVGDASYHVTGNYDRKTGLISCETIVSAEEKSRTLMSYFRDIASSQKGGDVDISFLDMAEADRYTNMYSKMCSLASEYQIRVDYSDGLSFIAAAKETIPNSDIRTFMANNNLDEFHDSHNSNLFHIIAKNDTANAYNVIQEAYAMYPEQTMRLLNTQNNEGITPLDVIHQYGNMNALAATYNLELPDYSRAPIAGNKFDEAEGVYIPVTKNILLTENAGFINSMVDRGLNVNYRDFDGNTLLHYYASGRIENLNIQSIMNHGAIINAVNNEGVTPIQMAVTLTEVNETGKLLQFGADPNCINMLLSSDSMRNGFDNYETFQHSKGKVILKMLLQSGANPNEQESTYAPTPLQIAAGIADGSGKIDYDSVKILILAGADPFQDTKGCLSLRDFAAETGNTELFKIMIDAGIDKSYLDIEHANFTVFERGILNRMERTIDMDLMEKIEKNQIKEAQNRTMDMDEINHSDKEDVSKSVSDEPDFAID